MHVPVSGNGKENFFNTVITISLAAGDR